MKRIPGIICFSVLILVACNSGSDKAGADTALATPPDTPADVALTPIDSIADPDPTDSIPGSRYPANSSSQTTADLVKAILVNDIFKNDLKAMDSGDRRFAFSELDINGDGKSEIFVGLRSPYFCGTGGCTLLLLGADGKKITSFTVSGIPIIVSPNKTKGWNDLLITSKGVQHELKFDGQKYPSNPSVQKQYKGLTSDEATRVLDYDQFPYPWFSF